MSEVPLWRGCKPRRADAVRRVGHILESRSFTEKRALRQAFIFHLSTLALARQRAYEVQMCGEIRRLMIQWTSFPLVRNLGASLFDPTGVPRS